MQLPTVCLRALLLVFAILQAGRRERLLVTGLIVPLVLLLRDPAQHDGYIVWTPYQQFQYSRHYAGNGDFAAGFLRVNHAGYQSIVNLSSWFVARHPNLLLGPADENPYNLPFRFAVLQPHVLVVGLVTGKVVDDALSMASWA